jgi:LmbE family N-acetylglucosaminyl deacetylase
MAERSLASLSAITDPGRPRIPGRTILVFAHPDDESLACGALLPRLEDVTIVHVTDGAPRNGEDARRRGFDTPADYAAARRRELAAAVALAGVAEARLLCLDVADQGAAFALAEVARRLAPMLEGADLVITHTYEGGHPDHDAVCWAVHAALGLLAGLGPALIEVPLYRLGPDGGWQRQSFEEGGGAVLHLALAERELKARMIAAHASQAETLAGFGVADEHYRAAPDYDFAQLPNGGALLYERYGWGLTGQRWLDLAADAARDLRLERAA